MRKLKMLLAAVAVIALGALGASAASAASGTGAAQVSFGGPPCTVLFDWNTAGGPPANGEVATLSNFIPPCSTPINEPPTTIDLTFDNTSPTGGVVIDGVVSVSISFVTCIYGINSIPGTYVETTGRVLVDASGTVVRTGGSFLCPASQALGLRADFFI